MHFPSALCVQILFVQKTSGIDSSGSYSNSSLKSEGVIPLIVTPLDFISS